MNNSLVSALKSIESTMVDFNKKFIFNEELQSEILKLKNSIINSITAKGTADLNLVKTDLSNIKSSNEEIN